MDRVIVSLCGCLRMSEWDYFQADNRYRFGRRIARHFKENPACLAKARQDTVWTSRLTAEEITEQERAMDD